MSAIKRETKKGLHMYRVFHVASVISCVVLFLKKKYETVPIKVGKLTRVKSKMFIGSVSQPVALITTAWANRNFLLGLFFEMSDNPCCTLCVETYDTCCTTRC